MTYSTPTAGGTFPTEPRRVGPGPRPTLGTAALLLALAASGCALPPAAAVPAREGSPDDLAAIRDLHEIDRRASLARDFETLRSILSDDAVVLAPGAPPLAGRRAIDENFRQMVETLQEIEVLDYELDFEEVRVFGDYAYEWGRIRGTLRDPATGEERQNAFKVLRILRREADGRWRIYRTMWNE